MKFFKYFFNNLLLKNYLTILGNQKHIHKNVILKKLQTESTFKDTFTKISKQE